MRLLYISPIPAESYAQRPHFMVRTLLDHGISSVLWVNPYPCRLPQWNDFRRPAGLHAQGTPLDPRVRALNVRALPIEPLPFGSFLNRQLLWRGIWREIEQFAASSEPLLLGIGRPCALAVHALRKLQPTSSFYDAMDNFPAFHRGLSRRAMCRWEDIVADTVDVILTSSTFLTEKFVNRHSHVEQVLNACDKQQETRAEGRVKAADRNSQENREAAELASHVSTSRVSGATLGYVGCIGRWFDWPLVIRLAESLPGANIELVGPCVARPHPQELPHNIRMLPACKHTEAAAHLTRFSAGLIPFRLNALTAGVDPIKYYEYRAAGLPVLSTRFGEMAFRDSRDGVYFLDGVNDWAAVATALDRTGDAAVADEFVAENNWDFRFQECKYFQSLAPASRTRRAA